MKVKEPQAEELARLRPGLVLFTYLHLAAYPRWPTRCSSTRSPASRTRPCRSTTGALPLLAPMSEVAGRMAPQVGAHFLEREHGGRGVLLGGARRAPGAGRRARRRQRRVERGVDRAGHGGRGAPARQEPRPAALGRPDPPGPDHDAGEQPRRGRARGRRRRPRDRRGARAGRARARRGDRRDGARR